jgi:ABC-type transport system substrate-binding protein
VGTYYLCDGRQSAYCNPKVDEMQKAASVLDGPARAKAYAEIAQVVYDDYATIPIGQPELFFGMSKRLNRTVRTDSFILVKEMSLNE